MLELSVTQTLSLEVIGVAKAIDASADALVMDEKDHVATAIKDIQAGETITYRIKDQTVQIAVTDPIPFGHKIAIVAIVPGTHVRKYGEVIGAATVDIAIGQHVHVHNIEGIRGRGDKAKTEGGAQ